MPCTAAWTLASSPPTSPANRCASLCWMPCSVSAGAPRPAYSFCQQSAAGWQAAPEAAPGTAGALPPSPRHLQAHPSWPACRLCSCLLPPAADHHRHQQQLSRLHARGQQHQQQLSRLPPSWPAAAAAAAATVSTCGFTQAPPLCLFNKLRGRLCEDTLVLASPNLFPTPPLLLPFRAARAGTPLHPPSVTGLH